MAEEILRRGQNKIVLTNETISDSIGKNLEFLAFNVEYFPRRMEQTILTDTQQKLLNEIGNNGLAASFYLAGGTSLAIQLRHRQSDDFDFFCVKEFDAERLRKKLSGVFSYELVLAEKQTLYVRVNGISVSYIHYPYSLLKPEKQYQKGILLAGVEDIAAMKLSTIAARGAKRDFLDLFTICKESFSLNDCFQFYAQRFHSASSDRYHLLRSITFFDDAEDEPMPILIKNIHWDDVKIFFVEEAKKLQ